MVESIERTVLHQRLANNLHEMGLRRTVDYLKKHGIVERIMHQADLLRIEERVTSREYFQERRIKRKLAAAASR